jgi:hypothetical protein
MQPSIHRALVASAFSVAVAGGIIAASAATLGGITTTDLGAENIVVAACDPDGIDIAYNHAYSASGQAYRVLSAVISDIHPDCENQALDMELTGAANASVATATQVTVGSSTTETVLFAAPPLADAVLGSAVVITGPAAP